MFVASLSSVFNLESALPKYAVRWVDAMKNKSISKQTNKQTDKPQQKHETNLIKGTKIIWDKIQALKLDLYHFDYEVAVAVKCDFT